MTAEKLQKVRKSQRRVWAALVRATGSPDLYSAITGLREFLRSDLAPPIDYIHKLARARQAQMPDLPQDPDTVPLSRFDEVLAMIDTPEKCDLVLATLSDEEIPAVEAFQHKMLYEIIPAIKARYAETARLIPPPPHGGRKKLVPSATECKDICDRITSLIAVGVSTGDAHQRVKDQINRKKSKEEELSTRTIQRIWRGRKTAASSSVSEPEER